MGKAQELKLVLKKKRMPQIEAAQLAGCTPTQLSAFFNGWTSMPDRHVKPLAEVLGVKPMVIKTANEEINQRRGNGHHG